MQLPLEYVAGLFDGEGCVTILKSKRKGRKNYQFHLQVAIANTFKPILDMIQKQFGFGSVGMCNHGNEKHSISYQLRITGEDTERFLNLIYPFTVIKKSQIEVGLEFRKLINAVGTNQSNCKNEVERLERFDERNTLYRKLASLKGKASRINSLSVAETKREDTLQGDAIVQTA